MSDYLELSQVGISTQVGAGAVVLTAAAALEAEHEGLVLVVRDVLFTYVGTATLDSTGILDGILLIVEDITYLVGIAKSAPLDASTEFLACVRNEGIGPLSLSPRLACRHVVIEALLQKVVHVADVDVIASVLWSDLDSREEGLPDVGLVASVRDVERIVIGEDRNEYLTALQAFLHFLISHFDKVPDLRETVGHLEAIVPRLRWRCEGSKLFRDLFRDLDPVVGELQVIDTVHFLSLVSC